VIAMPERDWNREVQESLQDLERREASVFHNPALARLYIERGVGVALVVVLTACATGLKGIDPHGRTLFLTCSIFGAMIAAALVGIGVAGLAIQRRQRATASSHQRDDGPPAIGW
jgi:hypothetical protein